MGKCYNPVDVCVCVLVVLILQCANIIIIHPTKNDSSFKNHFLNTASEVTVLFIAFKLLDLPCHPLELNFSSTFTIQPSKLIIIKANNRLITLMTEKQSL